MPRRPLLVLGLLLAVISMAGCGKEDPELIPQTRASALTSTIDEITAACDAEDPAKAKAAIEAANQQVSELPRKVSRELKDNIADWLAHIEDRVDSDCKAKAEETPTPTPTESPTPTPTVQPPGDGGVPAPEDGNTG